MPSPETIKLTTDVLAGVANLFTIAASALALYLWLSNRERISSALKLLLNFSFQITLSELKEKLERLNEYSANEPTEIEEIKNILHEISGQIQGNPKLLRAMPGLAEKIENLALGKGKKLTEPAKRSIVSEIREKVRNVQVDHFEIGDKS